MNYKAHFFALILPVTCCPKITSMFTYRTLISKVHIFILQCKCNVIMYVTYTRGNDTHCFLWIILACRAGTMPVWCAHFFIKVTIVFFIILLLCHSHVYIYVWGLKPGVQTFLSLWLKIEMHSLSLWFGSVAACFNV